VGLLAVEVRVMGLVEASCNLFETDEGASREGVGDQSSYVRAVRFEGEGVFRGWTDCVTT